MAIVIKSPLAVQIQEIEGQPAAGTCTVCRKDEGAAKLAEGLRKVFTAERVTNLGANRPISLIC
jgi:hypothetical protein